MPIYEYISESDGARIELLRPIGEADRPVEDPEHKGRVFKRVLSTFAAQGSGGTSAGPTTRSSTGGGCCPCGKPHGGCSSR